MNELLSYHAVEIRYQGQIVVHPLSVSLHEGEILGIVGESGSGKSTLLKATLGLLGPGGGITSGSIFFQGQPLPTSERAMQRIRGAAIGMIFQDAAASFCPTRTIGSQLYESMAAHQSISKKEAKRRALALLEQLQLDDAAQIWNRYPFELSGGMNQRVGIAAAMLMKPAVLLADEPTSALDVLAQKQVIQQMLHLREWLHTAILLVTHDIGVVSAMADTILVLQNGHSVEYGPAQEVLTAPKHPYTRQLLQAVPKLRRSP